MVLQCTHLKQCLKMADYIRQAIWMGFAKYSLYKIIIMKYTLFILGMFGILFGSHSELFGQQEKGPNIVLIMADDMGRETLGVYGSAVYETPNLDKMAAEGVLFTNMFSQPLCTPSRVKIMTGKHNYRNYTDFGYLDPSEITFGNLLQDAGYHTLIAGKWQLNGIYNQKVKGWDDVNRPYHFGFDEFVLWQVTKAKDEEELQIRQKLQNISEYTGSETSYS